MRCFLYGRLCVRTGYVSEEFADNELGHGQSGFLCVFFKDFALFLGEADFEAFGFHGVLLVGDCTACPYNSKVWRWILYGRGEFVRTEHLVVAFGRSVG